MRVVLDAGAVIALSNPKRIARVRALLEAGLWPPVLSSVVLVETLGGRGTRDAGVMRVVATSELHDTVPLALARRAGQLRRYAGRGSAVDAVVVATAEALDDRTVVLTSDPNDIEALTSHATGVAVSRV